VHNFVKFAIAAKIYSLINHLISAAAADDDDDDEMTAHQLLKLIYKLVFIDIWYQNMHLIHAFYLMNHTRTNNTDHNVHKD